MGLIQRITLGVIRMTKVLTFFMFQPERLDMTLAYGSTLYATLKNAASQLVIHFKIKIMFTKGNIIYADAFKYLKHKERKCHCTIH